VEAEAEVGPEAGVLDVDVDVVADVSGGG